MPPREWRLHIEDILAAIERVQRYTAGQDLASFLADEKTLDAVYFCFGVIGEAARHRSRRRGRGPSRSPVGGDARHAKRRRARVLRRHARDALEDSARRPARAHRAVASVADRAVNRTLPPGSWAWSSRVGEPSFLLHAQQLAGEALGNVPRQASVLLR